MVINPPVNLNQGESKPEKKRKSRWAEKSGSKSGAATGAAATTATGSGTSSGAETAATATSPAAATSTGAAKPLPAYLDLVNLTHVLSAEHMAKLNKLGISNLEQMLQVSFGQLTEVGLTLTELSEIQRKAEEAKPQSATDTT